MTSVRKTLSTSILTPRELRERRLQGFGSSVSVDSGISFIADLNPRNRQVPCLAQAVSWAQTPTALFPESLTGAWVEANLRTLATPFFVNLVTGNYFADPIHGLELVRQDELAVGSAAPLILSILPFPASSVCTGLRASNHLVTGRAVRSRLLLSSGNEFASVFVPR